MKKAFFLSLSTIALVAFCALRGELADVRSCLMDAESLCISNRWDHLMLSDTVNFECMSQATTYRRLAASVSNDFNAVLCSLDVVATNEMERLLVLGVGRQYGEDFYIAFLNVLSDMKTNNLISAQELSFARATTRYDLMSCLIRRHAEPEVIALLNKFKEAIPAKTNKWNDILSGVAYTNYIEEVEAGLWR